MALDAAAAGMAELGGAAPPTADEFRELEPLFEPERSHPKSVVVVTKEDGTVKEREVTDYAATRQQADASWSRMRVRLLRSRLRADDVARHLRAKGKPGENSFNARVQAEWVGDVVWGGCQAAGGSSRCADGVRPAGRC